MNMKKGLSKEVLATTPSEVLMKLEQIKTFLMQEKASVMVGAGFSKNAQMMEHVAMKEWNELSENIFNQLFVKEDDKQHYSHIRHDALKISQMYECSFGRNALDTLIENSLPDDAIAPGKLHKQLMNLHWRDVFTTNYDTLLERAALDADFPYQVVTNKETLLYKKSPRIIKLHGSFPNIRPYIITEEDFRTYPQKYPEFVNTVRQALMESVFCLIGFSGNDPNFLQWLGWLRDVMGNQASPVYLITYEKDMHKAQVDLFKRRGIEIINLATIREGISYSEGFEIILTYLSDKNENKWSPSIGNTSFSKPDEIVKATERMSHIRNGCPNYLYLPKKNLDEFDNAYPFYYWIDRSLLDQLTETQRIQFVYEVVWLYEVSMSPIFCPWLLDEMERISFAERDNEDDVEYANEIRLSLLTASRMHGDDTYFERLAAKINEKSLTSAQWHRYYYELCLYYLGLLNYKHVRELLNQWDVTGSRISSVLWKALVMSEIGQENETINLLNTTNQRFKQTLLTQGIHDESMMTYSEGLDEALELHDTRKLSETSLHNLKRYLVQKMVDAYSKPSKAYEDIHRYGINDVQSTWHSTTNARSKLLYSYHYIRLLEKVGFPLGHSQFTINESWLQTTIENIILYLPTYAFRTLVRSRSQKVTIDCLTRKVVLALPENWADEQYEKYKAKIDDYNTLDIRNTYTIKIGDVVIPAFAYLSPRLNEGHIDDFREQYQNCYNAHKRAYDQRHFGIVLGNLFSGGKARANYFMLSETKDDWLQKLPWSHEWMHITTMSDSAVDSLAAKVRSLRESEDNSVFARLGYMLSTDLTKEQRSRLEDAVREWRNKDLPEKYFEYILNTYRQVKYIAGKDERNVNYYIDEIIRRLEETNVDKVGGSAILLHLREYYGMLEFYVSKMTPLQHEIAINKFQRLLVENEKILQKDDSKTFMGGFRGELQKLIIYYTRYIANANLQTIDEQILVELQKVCERYLSYNVAMLGVIAKLNNYTERTDSQLLMKDIKEALLKGEHYEYSEALYAVEITRFKDIQKDIFHFLVEYTTNAQNMRVLSFIKWIRMYIVDGKMQKRIWFHKINELLCRIADSVADFNGEEEFRMDIMFQANKLAGAVYAKWGEMEGVDRWKDITKDRKNFNDVRAGFDLGQDLVIKDKDELYNRLLLHG